MATKTRTPGRRMNHTTSERHTDVEQRLADIQQDIDNNHDDADNTSADNDHRPADDPYYGSLLEVAARTRRLGPPPIDPSLPGWSQVLNAILDSATNSMSTVKPCTRGRSARSLTWAPTG